MITPQAPGTDGVRLAVVSNRFQAIARKMINTLFRTGRSGVLNTARDFSCCILTADGRLVATAESLPIHVLSGDLLARSIVELHDDIAPGDAFLHNSPYHGNSHAADFTVLVPVFDHQGRHRLTVFAKAHQAVCGNAVPTTYSAEARDVYEEGALIFPAVRVQRDYRDVGDIVRMCQMRIRVADQWWGDHLAMLGAARIGEREAIALGREVGWLALERHIEGWFEYGELRMRQAIARLPEGRVEGTTVRDPLDAMPDGITIKAVIEVQSAEERIVVDLRDNPDCVPCGLNLTEATARTAAQSGVLNSISETVPINAGSLGRIEVLLRENCVVGIPRHPASCSLATNNVADRLSNVVQRAMAGLGDCVGAAEAGLCLPPSGSVISGRDPRNGGEPFVNQIITGMTGGPASPTADGWLTFCMPGCAGMLRFDSVEVDELQYPIYIHEQRVLVDSEGAGRRRGAPSARVEIGPAGCELECMWAADGNVHAPQGARGGAAGRHSDQLKRRPDGSLTPLPATARVRLAADETVVSICAAGGGYGAPTERDPEAVKRDVQEGWITRARAEQVYAVRFTDTGEVDADATRAARR
jgi:N-methylhydantoinase B